MKVNGLPTKCRWKECLKCTCEGQLKECLHCKYTKRENSIPKENFTVKDKDGNDHLITEITVVVGEDGDIIGWHN